MLCVVRGWWVVWLRLCVVWGEGVVGCVVEVVCCVG